MPTEVVLKELCPKCYQETGVDNPLRAFPGSFMGNYCVVGSDNHHGHEYPDTLELNAELIKAAKDRKKARKQVALPIIDEVKPQTEGDGTEIAPMREPAQFEVGETDAARLSELLGQPVSDAGTLVGAVYSMKVSASQASSIAGLEKASITSLDSTVIQSSDGTLALQVYFPWKTAKGLVEKAQFNGMNIQSMTQDFIEYLMGANYFPGGLFDVKVSSPEPYDGFWMVIRIPELYVGSMLTEAEVRKVTPTQYLQAFVESMVQQEQFV